MFSVFVCCGVMCLYVRHSVLCCPLWFLHGSGVRFVFAFSCLLETHVWFPLFVFVCPAHVVLSFSSYCVPCIVGKESENLPYLYWIPKLHKTPYKERYTAGSSTCSTKELSIHLTKILSAVKEGQQKYCETVYSCSGINHMWILKNSKDLLDNLKSRSFSRVSSIKTWFFYSVYHPTAWQIKNPLKRNHSQSFQS